MKKVKITQPVMLNGSPVKAGTVVELDDGLAKNLILRGRAELATASKAEPATPPAKQPEPPAPAPAKK